jgi:hypothetical protein
MVSILYISSVIEESKYNYLRERSYVHSHQAMQKFHSLLINGIYNLNLVSICILSRICSGKRTENLNVNSVKDRNNNIYHYINVGPTSFIMQVYVFFYSLFFFVFWVLSNLKNKKVVIIDVLNISSGLSTFLISKIFFIKSVAIVTDIPEILSESKGKSKFLYKLFYKIYKLINNSYDYYVVLSENMNRFINKRNRPYLLLEGIIKEEVSFTFDKSIINTEKKIFLYSGGIEYNSGIIDFAKSFSLLKNDNIELHVYGEGEAIDSIKAFGHLDSRIKYLSSISNSEIIKKQKESHFLVNPRPVDNLYATLSFPSKLMEYLVSGTPVLSTKLPQIPEEYFSYINFIDIYEGSFLDSLCNILNQDYDFLKNKALLSREFCLKNKNNRIQAKKIIQLIDGTI